MTPPVDEVGRFVAFLESQSRIELVASTDHEHGDDADQHLLFGVSEQDWRDGDLRALEHGLEREVVGSHAWLDPFSVADADTVRRQGVVLREQTRPGADRLDCRLTSEPFAADDDALEQFAASLADLPAIRDVGAPVTANVLDAVTDAAQTTILAGRTSWSASVGRPDDGTVICAR